MRKLLLLVSLLFLLTGCSAQNAGEMEESDSTLPPVSVTQDAPKPEEPEEPEPIVATLTVAGDVMNHNTQISDAYDAATDSYDYSHVFQYVKPWLEQADYAVANLETTLPGGGDYTGYPNFGAPDALAYDLKEAGFDLLSTANNHTRDKGMDGVYRTLDALDEVGLAHVGTYRSQEERDNSGIVVADVGGIKVAFLAYTYGLNGYSIPEDQSYAVNLFNLDYTTTLSQPDEALLAADLEKARGLDADLIAVMIHWGIEYRNSPSDYQKSLAEFLVANGADLILGGHPHVIEPYETITTTGWDGQSREGFVCYSLGNFISAQNKEFTDVTALLQLELTKDETGTHITDVGYVPFYMLHRWGQEKTDFLLDAHRGIAEYGQDPLVTDLVRQALEKAVAHCQEIFGAEGDLGQAAQAGVPQAAA